MDPQLHRAAELGNWDVIKIFESEFDSQLTPNNDTVLHVLAQFCESSFAVEEILTRNPKLLLKLNAKSETALHVAARKGHVNVARALLECVKHPKESKSLLISQNKDRNLALHEAVKENCADIVRFFLEEDPSLIHVTNKAKQCALYIAADRSYERIAALILDKYDNDHNNSASSGPHGRSVLHAAARRNSPGIVNLIVGKLPHLLKEVDNSGWTPLHFAARFNHHELARQLILADRSMAYVRAHTIIPRAYMFLQRRKASGNTALHVAVIHGNTQVMEVILSYCPDCWQMVTKSNMNLRHLAVQNEQTEVLDFILEKSWASDLMNQRDDKGNTPLHLYTSTRKLQGYNLVNHPKADINASNRADMTPLDLVILEASDQIKERQVSIKIELERAGATPEVVNAIFKEEDTNALNDLAKQEAVAQTAESYLVAATLILTICFTFGFAIPGGYDSSDGDQKGIAALANKLAFKIFIFTDAFALCFALGSMLLLLLIHGKSPIGIKLNELNLCRIGIGTALSLLVISFATGLYASLPTKLGKQIVSVLVLSSCPLVFSFIYFKLRPVTHFLYSPSENWLPKF